MVGGSPELADADLVTTGSGNAVISGSSWISTDRTCLSDPDIGRGGRGWASSASSCSRTKCLVERDEGREETLFDQGQLFSDPADLNLSDEGGE